jgi:hypothetical protein
MLEFFKTLDIWLQEANLVLKEHCEKVKTFSQAGFFALWSAF